MRREIESIKAKCRQNQDKWMKQRSATLLIGEELNKKSKYDPQSSITVGSSPSHHVHKHRQEEILSRITERIANNLTSEIKNKYYRENMTNKDVEHKVESELDKYMETRLSTHVCPICFELMHVPMIIFPCGHTFCKDCIENHKRKSKIFTCPFCRVEIKNCAVNGALKSLVESFIKSKAAMKKTGDLTSVTVESRGLSTVNPLKTTTKDENMNNHQEIHKPNGKLKNRQLIEKYTEEFNSCSVRKEILIRELKATQQSMKQTDEKLETINLVLKTLHTEENSLLEKLKSLESELSLVRQHISQKESNKSTAVKEHEDISCQLKLIASTCTRIDLNQSKLKLMLEHLSPGIQL